MSRSNYLRVVGFIFLVITVLHALRLLNDWGAVIGGAVIPVWASWFGVLLAAYLSWQGFKMAKSA